MSCDYCVWDATKYFTFSRNCTKYCTKARRKVRKSVLKNKTSLCGDLLCFGSVEWETFETKMKKKPNKKKTTPQTADLICAPDDISSADIVPKIVAGRSSDKEPAGGEASGYRALMAPLRGAGGRTGEADRASGSHTQQASWEKALQKPLSRLFHQIRISHHLNFKNSSASM